MSSSDLAFLAERRRALVDAFPLIDDLVFVSWRSKYRATEIATLLGARPRKFTFVETEVVTDAQTVSDMTLALETSVGDGRDPAASELVSRLLGCNATASIFGDLTTADMSYCTGLDDSGVAAICRHHSNLARLSIKLCAGVTIVGFAAAIRAPKLEILDASRLDLVDVVGGVAPDARESRTSPLRALSLVDCTLGEQACELVRTECRGLRLVDARESFAYASDSFASALAALPELEVLDLGGWCAPWRVMVSACRGPKLHTACLNYCRNFDAEALRYLITNCSSVRHLLILGANSHLGASEVIDVLVDLDRPEAGLRSRCGITVVLQLTDSIVSVCYELGVIDAYTPRADLFSGVAPMPRLPLRKRPNGDFVLSFAVEAVLPDIENKLLDESFDFLCRRAEKNVSHRIVALRIGAGGTKRRSTECDCEDSDRPKKKARSDIWK